MGNDFKASTPIMLREPRRLRRSFTRNSGAAAVAAAIAAIAFLLIPQCAAAAEAKGHARTASVKISRAPHGAPAKKSAETLQPAENHRRAHFGRERASSEAREIADWIVESADNLNLPFVIVDKVDARVFVFDPRGRLKGAAAALLGVARGDDTVPGIGDREYADMPPETRTTPAGRFVADIGIDARGEDVVWVDYEAAVSLHRVITTKPEERRLERLATPTPLDNRISYGCINVPKKFYETVVSPAFTGTQGIVYVLPETRPAREVFASYRDDDRSRRRYLSQAEATR